MHSKGSAAHRHIPNTWGYPENTCRPFKLLLQILGEQTKESWKQTEKEVIQVNPTQLLKHLLLFSLSISLAHFTIQSQSFSQTQCFRGSSMTRLTKRREEAKSSEISLSKGLFPVWLCNWIFLYGMLDHKIAKNLIINLILIILGFAYI